MSSSNNIKVVARFRPQNQIELAKGGRNSVNIIEDHSVVLKCNDLCATFTFDKTFDDNTSQQDLFAYSIGQTIEDIFNGYNGTVLAYGQTGSGKTYTMMGSDIEDDYKKGIIPRIVEGIFDKILNSPPSIEYLVKVSYLEIYMEKVRDLLNPSQDNLQIHEGKTSGVYVKDLMEVFVGNINEVYATMKEGGKYRAVAETNMNEESSRSHSIFQLSIQQTNTTDGKIKLGKLYLVDLAGSEKLGKTGATGQTLEEAKKINKSLSALGNVINSLTDGKSTHIPYRDSKLTRILQESLGGNSRTTLIINCSPSSYNINETLSTLRFGTRAKSIKNRATINQELSSEELKDMINKLQTKSYTFKAYIFKLENELAIWRDGRTVEITDQISWDKFNSSKLGKPSKQTQQSSKPLKSPNLILNSENKINAQIVEHQKLDSNGFDNAEAINSSDQLVLVDINSGETVYDQENEHDSENRGHSISNFSLVSPVSKNISRSTTPNFLPSDEQEGFLKRENELVDLLSEKEKALLEYKALLEDLSEELEQLKNEKEMGEARNKKLVLENTQIKAEKMTTDDENNENKLLIDQLKESVDEIQLENKELKAQLENYKEQVIYLKAKSSMQEKNLSLKTTETHAKRDSPAVSPKIIPQQVDRNLANDENVIREGLMIRKNDPELKNLIVERNKLLESETVNHSQVYENIKKENEILVNKLSQSQVSYKKLFEEFETHLRNSLTSHEEINRGKLGNIEQIIEKMESQYVNKISNQATEIQKLSILNASQAKEMEYFKNIVDSYKYKESLGNNTNTDTKSKLSNEELLSEKMDTPVSNAPENGTVNDDGTTPRKPAESVLDSVRRETVNDELVKKLNEQYEKSMEMEKQIDLLEGEVNRLRIQNSNSVKSRRMEIIEKTIFQLKDKSDGLISQNKDMKKQLVLNDRKVDHLAARNESLKEELSKLVVENDHLHNLNERLSVQLLSSKRQSYGAQNGLKALPFGRVAKPIRGGGGVKAHAEPPGLASMFTTRSISLNSGVAGASGSGLAFGTDPPSYITSDSFLDRMSYQN